MYLISIYFDENTEKRIQNLMKNVAKETGNTYMQDNHVPPHITVAAVETRDEAELLAYIEETARQIHMGNIKFVSVGTFLSQVIYIQPVLNEYLHNISVYLSHKLEQMKETNVRSIYRPFSWLPHCTIGKQLSCEQMVQAFTVLQKQFVPTDGKVVRIGVAKTNPHRNIKVWELNR